LHKVGTKCGGTDADPQVMQLVGAKLEKQMYVSAHSPAVVMTILEKDGYKLVDSKLCEAGSGCMFMLHK